MPRYKLTIEYAGTELQGWQYQEGYATAQGCLEQAALDFAGEKVLMYGAGRTDAGVHATGQVAHVDFTKDWTPYKVLHGLNFHLQDTPVKVLEAEAVDEDFHARFSASGRRYLYRIINRSAPLSIDLHRACHVKKPLDAAAMQAATAVLVGHHDFTSFRDSECQSKSPEKTLDELRVERINAQEIHIHAASRSFLHHQVRIMVGSLIYVGLGKWTDADLQQALDARDRRAGGPTAPADGLYLTEVRYS